MISLESIDGGAAYYLSEWVVRVVMLFYVPQRRSPAASRTWLLLIFLLPWPGLVIYAMFGRIRVPKRRIEVQAQASHLIRAVQARMKASVTVDPKLPPNLAHAVLFASRLGDFRAFSGNRIELLPDYRGSIDRLVADIGAARENVHALYYIFAPDATGMRVADALIEAAARGVRCSLLIDAVGSKHGLRELAPRLRAGNVEVLEVMPVGLLRRNAARFDLRNHRKIAVIDGRIGYTGSQNIVDPEFVPGHPNEELVVRVTGPVVAQLQAVFFVDHHLETGVIEEREGSFPELSAAGASVAQAVPSGPGFRRENGQELIVTLLYAAEKRVVITTPYFVPDEIFLQALRSATLRGVDVHLVLSKHPDQHLTFWAQCSYYELLLEAGVKIHLYRPHFLHAKHLSIDDHIALIGSTNIDIRSFALNAEINLVIYDPEVVGELRAIQERYFAESDLVSAEEWAKRPVVTRTIQNVARLADSLL